VPTRLDDVAAEVAAGLERAGIAFSCAPNGWLWVVLPGGFGEFEIGALVNSTRGDSYCGLVGYNWHSHADPLQLVLDVFAGKCLLIEEYPAGKIEEYPPGKFPRKYVTYDLAEFLDALPPGATYKVYNATQQEL
jgi:hypothetical protein